MAKIHVIHENGIWLEPLRRSFVDRRIPFVEWSSVEGRLDLGSVPPEGVFYNRMSASSHTRGHRHAPEMASLFLAWLEAHGRRVVNDGRALALEVNKVAQYAALAVHAIRTPRTVAAVGRAAIVDAAAEFPDGPFILKPNRGGKGQGVRRFDDIDALTEYIAGNDFEPPIDGVSLIQEYIAAPRPFITRAEFVGGRFLYAVRVDTSGGFELCPADVCQVADEVVAADSPLSPKFEIVDPIDDDLRVGYESFLAANGIEIAGIEFITDAAGRAYIYDVNTNTNYNPEAEARAGISGMDAVAQFLGSELALIEADRSQSILLAG